MKFLVGLEFGALLCFEFGRFALCCNNYINFTKNYSQQIPIYFFFNLVWCSFTFRVWAFDMLVMKKTHNYAICITSGVLSSFETYHIIYVFLWTYDLDILGLSSSLFWQLCMPNHISINTCRLLLLWVGHSPPKKKNTTPNCLVISIFRFFLVPGWFCWPGGYGNDGSGSYLDPLKGGCWYGIVTWIAFQPHQNIGSELF